MAKGGCGINLIFKATSLRRVCPLACVWLNHCYPPHDLGMWSKPTDQKSMDAGDVSQFTERYIA